MFTQRAQVASKGLVATNTNGHSTMARTIPEGPTKGREVKPKNKPPRHEESGSKWITYKSTTRRMKKLGSPGQKTTERRVLSHKGLRSDWIDEFPPLPSFIAKEPIVAEESRVQPAKDVQIPASCTLPSSSEVVVNQNDKREKGKGKNAKDVHCGGGADDKEEDKDKRMSKRMRFAKSVNVRIFGLDTGNENTLRRVMTEPIGEDKVRITKPTIPSGIDKQPTTDETQQAVDRANDATAHWTIRSNNTTYASVSIDSASFNTDRSEDDTMELYDDNEMEAIFSREIYDPEMFQKLTLQFNIFEQLPLMDDRQWWYETEKICDEAQKTLPLTRSSVDRFLGQDSIYGGLLKTLNDCGSNEYAVSYPIDIQLDYTVEALRANIVRKPDAKWILQPILIQQHWILACYHPETSRVIIHDSLYHGYTKARKETTIEWIQLLFDELIDDNRVKLSVKFARRDFSFHQTDGVNCGIYVLLHAQRFMHGRRKLVGKLEDQNINLMQERRNLLGLVKSMEAFIDRKYHYNDPVQQYDQHPIEFSHIRELRRSPRNIASQLQAIRDCVKELNKGRCKTMKRRKRVSVGAANTTVNGTTAGLPPPPGSPTVGSDPTSNGSPQIASPTQIVSSPNGSTSPNGSPPTAHSSPPQSPPNTVSSPPNTCGLSDDTVDTSTRLARKRQLSTEGKSRGSSLKRRRIYSDSDDEITITDQVPKPAKQSAQLSARELRAKMRLEKMEEEARNGGEDRRGTKRRRRSDDKEDGEQDSKKQRLDPGRRGQKRRSTSDDDETELKRSRNDASGDDEDRNVTRRRGARATRRRSSGASLIGSRQ